MTSIWEKFRKEITVSTCDWCNNQDELHHYDSENVCRQCLEDTEYEEAEHGLTLDERNA